MDNEYLLLAEQLSPPLERPSWPTSDNYPPEQVLVMPDEDSSFAVVTWVRYEAHRISLVPAPGPAAEAIQLQRLDSARGRQRLNVTGLPEEATHLLVMGWVRWRRAPQPFDRTLFHQPIKPLTDGPDVPVALLTAFAPKLLQAALNAVLKKSPGTIETSLLNRPEPALLAPAAEPGDRHEDSPRSLPTTPVADTRSPRLGGRIPDTAAAWQARTQDTRLIFASCQYPAGLLDHRPASASFRRMEETARAHAPLGALLMLGDQIYADATYGILDPTNTSDRFKSLYLDLHRSLRQYETIDHMRKLAKPQLYVTPDDHEIRDNWEPGGPRVNQDDKDAALKAFERMSLSRLPARQTGGGFWGPVDAGGGHEVFMLDTRTERQPRPWGPGPGMPAAHIMGGQQQQALEGWLLKRHTQDGAGPVTPKLISSPVWLLPRRVGNATNPSDSSAHRSDSWDGYPASLQWLLGFIAEKQIRGVVMLCGDAHLAGHTRVNLKHGTSAATLHILHAPALYAPFPFANGQPHHYRCHQDQMSWADGATSCQVDSELWVLGDGFVHLSLVRERDVWHVRATFDVGATRSRSDFWTVD
ncbi:MAG: alkaline phosphatase D family protein [Hydrogenophaga sp.]|nr:alkaline phosphatase D family protein [Hydrogenophaga sp.]